MWNYQRVNSYVHDPNECQTELYVWETGDCYTNIFGETRTVNDPVSIARC